VVKGNSVKRANFTGVLNMLAGSEEIFEISVRLSYENFTLLWLPAFSKPDLHPKFRQGSPIKSLNFTSFDASQKPQDLLDFLGLF
jgi:hypothetical protein